MRFLKINESTRRIAYSTLVLSLTVLTLLFVAKTKTASAAAAGDGSDANSARKAVNAPSATFPANAPTLGAIPDGTAGGNICGDYSAGRDVTFTVTGLSGTITDVRVNFTLDHSWVGDLDVSLRGPGGAPVAPLFFQTGSTTGTGCGDSSNLVGPYNMFDTASAAPTWWGAAATAADAAPIPAGDYRPSTVGGVVGGGANTVITPTFAATSPNGTWTLRVRDGGEGDTGSITAANLTITAGAAVPSHANADFNGDGKTDYTVARSNGGQITWYTSVTGTGAYSQADWGAAASDFVVTGDFDGDGKSDLTVWREAPATQAAFYILQSSNNTVRYEQFGQTGDDPAVIGDYDGDGKFDPAVFRCPPFATPAAQCYFYYRGSLANPSGITTYIPWGFGNDGDFFPYVGDFDGDGKNDFCLQRTNPNQAGQGQFVLLKSNGFGVEYINWGNSSDFLIPGDYDGDGKTDFCVRRTVSGVRQHWLLTRTGAQSMVTWGITGDTSAPGDYDGDAKTDFAVWRPNADPNQNFFYVLRSSDGALQAFEWGQTGDFAVAGWAVH